MVQGSGDVGHRPVREACLWWIRRMCRPDRSRPRSCRHRPRTPPRSPPARRSGPAERPFPPLTRPFSDPGGVAAPPRHTRGRSAPFTGSYRGRFLSTPGSRSAGKEEAWRGNVTERWVTNRRASGDVDMPIRSTRVRRTFPQGVLHTQTLGVVHRKFFGFFRGEPVHFV